MSPSRIFPVRRAAWALALLLSAPLVHAACYTVLGADQQVLYRAQTPPVDMSLPLHETLPRIAPGASLVFSLYSGACDQEVYRLPASTQGVVREPSAGIAPQVPPERAPLPAPRGDRG